VQTFSVKKTGFFLPLVLLFSYCHKDHTDPSSPVPPNEYVNDSLTRQGAAGFSIGNKIYIGTGLDGSSAKLTDFWQFDLTTNTWKRLADFPGAARTNAAGFAVKGKGYIATGSGSVNYNDVYQYDPIGDSWKKMADFPGGLLVLLNL